MNKKRYLIIIIILLFLFLTIFSFANPFGNGGGNPNNKPLEEIEEEDLINKEETKPADRPAYDNNEVEIDKVVVEDNSYELALEAVKKAEITLTEEDYDNALVLVGKVNDKEKKEELEKRLDEVLDSIKLKELVEKLVKMTKESTNKDELDEAREFNVSNKILDKISNLNNEILKEALQKAVDNIAYLLNDTKVPTINIEDGAILNSDTVIKVEDENKVIIVLNGSEIENNYTAIDGIYELVVTDVAFNEVKITFTVDTIAPEGTLKYSIDKITNKDVVVTLTTNEDVTVTNNDGKFEYTFTKNGEFTFEFVDVAGNKGNVKAVVDYIDKTAPEVEVAYSNKNLTNKNVIVKLTISEEIKEVEGWNLSENKMTLIKELEVNEEGKVTVKDLAGNTIEVGYSVTNIDKTLPEAEVTYNNEELTNGNVIVTITVTEEVNTLEGWTLSEDKKVLTKEVEANEEGKVTIEDLAGNTLEVEYSVANIDKKSPTVTGVRDGKYYKEATPVIEDENLESVKLNGIDFRSGKTIKLNGNYTLVATDKAGNTTTVTFTVDSIKPIILVLDILDFIQTDLIPIKPIIIDANLDTVVVLKDGVDIGYKVGDQLEGEGSYEIIATDKAGNTSSAKFTADNKGPEIKKDGLIPLAIPPIGGVYKEVKIRIDEENFDEKSVLVLKKSSINLPFDYSLPTYKKIDFTYGDTLTEEGEYIVLAADKAFNISFVSFIIDTTAPVVNATNGAYYQNLQLNVEDASLLSTVVYKKGSNGWYEKTNYTNGDLITEDGEYKVSATDKVLQNTTVEFTIDAVDPTIDGVVNNYVYLEASPVVSDTNLDTVVVTKDGNVIASKEKYTENGMYVITATDKACRITTVSFEINSEVLKINEPTGGMYLDDVTPVITHRVNITPTLTRNGAVISYKEGDTLTEAGNYTLTVVDEYNNQVSISFVVDKAAPNILTDTLPSKVAAQDENEINVLVTVTDDIDANKTILPTTVTHSTLGKITVVDNKISTTKNEAGVYTLVYETTDTAGRTSTKTAKIEVVRSDVSIKVTTNTTIDEKPAIKNTYDKENQLSKTYIPVSFVDEKGTPVTGLSIDDIIIKAYKRDNKNNLVEVTELENVGEYVIIASVNGNKPGYENIFPTQAIDYVITPYELTINYVPANEKSKNTEYDGFAKVFKPQVTTLEGETVSVGDDVSTGTADVGTYTLVTTVKYQNANYTIVDPQPEITITQATLNVEFPTEIKVAGTIEPKFKNLNNNYLNIAPTIYYLKKTGSSWIPYSLKESMTEVGSYTALMVTTETTNYKFAESDNTLCVKIPLVNIEVCGLYKDYEVTE